MCIQYPHVTSCTQSEISNEMRYSNGERPRKTASWAFCCCWINIMPFWIIWLVLRVSGPKHTHFMNIQHNTWTGKQIGVRYFLLVLVLMVLRVCRRCWRLDSSTTIIYTESNTEQRPEPGEKKANTQPRIMKHESHFVEIDFRLRTNITQTHCFTRFSCWRVLVCVCVSLSFHEICFFFSSPKTGIRNGQIYEAYRLHWLLYPDWMVWIYLPLACNLCLNVMKAREKKNEPKLFLWAFKMAFSFVFISFYSNSRRSAS